MLSRVLVVAALASARPAVADPVKAAIDIQVLDGYVRVVLTMSEYDDAKVRLSGNVLIVTFEKPVLATVESMPAKLPDLFAAARRDPDGKAIRVALTQQVKLNATPAGQKVFIDLLPETWTGPPPGLPPDVMEDLAQRAREGDRLVRQEKAAQQQQKPVLPVRVHVATLPTFTRYIFDVPRDVSVSANHEADNLTLTFGAPVKFDLGDAPVVLPSTVKSINTELKDA
ncbi:MAG TPA: tetratricopeptide repeat protein, partial [Xanthobacteraceae bacterium]|nr:tetratricopeptide repeat protein [Xanthobacteraceae bacterium]